ncbi:MAG: DUF11 domain-containing protein [Coriobacteriia bacterium]|nr:DUF11 domain-containing protein [Coriobacteriia bacterium]
MTNILWARAQGRSAGVRLISLCLALAVFTMIVGPSVPMQAVASETTSTPEPSPDELAPGDPAEDPELGDLSALDESPEGEEDSPSETDPVVEPSGETAPQTVSAESAVVEFGEPWVISDRDDYAPGSLVTLSGGDWLGDSAVHLQVNDVIGNSWLLEVQVPVAEDGTFTYAFYLPTWFVAEYLVVATGAETGRVATAVFTDAVLLWRAADPQLNNRSYMPTYDKLSPSGLDALPGISYPFTGAHADPYQHAVAYGPTNASNDLDAVASLTPDGMTLGQVVPFELIVDGAAAGASGVINVKPFWMAKTTNGDDFGFDPAYGVLGAFVDTGDAYHEDSGASATVSGLSWSVVNGGTSNEKILGSVTVSGLQTGDKIIVEMWVVLKGSITEGTNGVIQTGIDSATTPENPDKSFASAAMTCPLRQAEGFLEQIADLSITKSDSPDPVVAGAPITYTMVVTNTSTTVTSYDVVIEDVLDPLTTYVPGSVTISGATPIVGPTFFAGVLNIPLGTMVPGQVATVTFQATANVSLPMSGVADSSDRVNSATVDAATTDDNPANDTATAMTGVIPPVPDISVTKTASPTSVPETGGNVVYTFVITNNNAYHPITITEITDDKFGAGAGPEYDLLPAAKSQNGGMDITLAPGGAFAFTYSATLASDSLTPHTNNVTVTGVDSFQRSDTATDDETVTFTDVPPVISVTKTAIPKSVPEDGGYVTFTVTVYNPGPEDVTLTGLVDDVFGDLTLLASTDLTLPQYIPIGDSYSGWFTVPLSSDTLTPHTNTVTATAVDDEQTEVTDSDDETVTFTDVVPEITVTKTADPTSVPETGGDVTFTVVVENTGTEPVTLTGAVDTVFGTIDVSEFDKTYLVVGDEATYSFTEWLEGEPSSPHEDVVTVTAVDNEETEATDYDDADVTFTDVEPSVDVEKLAEPLHMIMPGGTFDYTADVTNTSPEPVQIMSVEDSLFGTVYEWAEGDPEIWLDPDESRTFEFSIDHTEPGTYLNVVEAAVVDNDGSAASDEAEASVLVTDPGISLEKSSDAPPEGVLSGTLVTYTYVVSNIGDVTLFDAVLVDDQLGQIGTIDELEVGGSRTFTKSTTLTDGVTNIAMVTAIDEYENQVQDSDEVTIDTYLPFTELDLAITKSANRSVADVGDVITYTLTYWNNGDLAAENFTISDDYDERYVTLVDAGGGAASGGVITWTLPGPLTAAGGKQTLTYSVRVKDDMPEGRTNVDNVVVIRHPRDSNDSNDTASHRVVVEVDEPFLPFTGAEYLLLILAVIIAGVVGLALRLASHKSS